MAPVIHRPHPHPAVLVTIIGLCIFIAFIRCHAKEENDFESILPNTRKVKLMDPLKGIVEKGQAHLGN